MTAAPRHAVYWAPEASDPLWRAGCAWLGRDPTDPSFEHPPHEATAGPRRYGFHATLKAPFFLRDGVSESSFVEAVQTLAGRTQRFAMPALEVAELGDFIAIRPTAPPAVAHPLRQLADDCVRGLDPWRAPSSPPELQRRQQDGSLSPEQAGLLQAWGYPHVLDHWRFHMTLSDALPRNAAGEAQRRRLLAEARAFFAATLDTPLDCASICIFVEPARGEPFRLAHRCRLAT